MFSKQIHFTSLLIIFWCFANVFGSEPDFYDLLAISRNANNQEIRKAFKKMALKMHPDKNVDDPEAHEKFLKITRAYEILKQPETRKHYDVHGDTGSDLNSNNHYQSYSYYRDEFGIYDDDPIIITLSASDYEVNILDDSQAWFVNFYSPRCHHCHELAPTWRKIAKEFQGVIKVAAVNCEDDWSLCYQLNIPSYPTLMFYEKQASLHEGKRFSGSKTFESIEDFILSEIPSNIEIITEDKWKKKREETRHWLFFFCTGKTDCLESKTQIKLAAALGEIMNIGVLMDDKLARNIYKDYIVNPIIYWQKIEKDMDKDLQTQPVSGSDFLEIMDNILNLLPSPQLIDENYFKKIRQDLQGEAATPWLLCFYMGSATDLDLQLKRLPSVLTNINIGLVHCGKSSHLCSELHISSYPVWGVLKVGGAFELHHGRDVLHEISTFARDSVRSINLRALSPKEFEEIRREDGMWFIDWYAPWCPPCKRLLPELRRASQHFGRDKVQFGTIDCTLHRTLCSKEGITAYPTTILYNNSKIEHFHGVPNEDGIVSFLDDLLNSKVISLDDSTFVCLMRKPKDELWFVDYFAPWCGPCQKLSLQWRKLAQELVDFAQVKIAQIDCVSNVALCQAQNIKAYPTLRLYPFDSKGLNSVVIYNGNWELVTLKRWLLHFIPSPIKELRETDFDDKIQNGLEKPMLVDFFAPWCGHCVHFETIFRKVAKGEIMNIGVLMDDKLARNIYKDYIVNPIIYWQKFEKDMDKDLQTQPVSGSDFLEIMDNILNLLPSPQLIDENYFKKIRQDLQGEAATPWLLCFYMGSATDLDLQLKRLPSVLTNINIGLVHCGKSSHLCSELHISSYPVWGVLKVGGAFELHHGRDVLHEISTFARDSVRSINLRALSPKEFEEIRREDGMWFIDWYAPWCPPCKRLLPELRRASQHFGRDKVQFGTIDCTLHRTLCSKEGITAYPTTILYNNSKIEHFHGVPNEDGIVSFLDDLLNSKVISLDDSTFVRLMRKPKDELWFVDYFAPWCGPCQKLSLQWRKLAQELVDFAQVKIAQIDCVSNVALCQAQNIKAYPTLRLYPFDSKGLNSVVIYNGNWELVTLKRWLLHFIPSPIKELRETDFDDKIQNGLEKPMLVDFFAPWCGHCVHFETIFRKVAKELEGYVNCAQVNCQTEKSLCRNLHIDAYPTVMLYISNIKRYEINARNVEDIVRKVILLVDHSNEKQVHDEF